MSELETLIAEQERDDRGSFQPPEAGTVPLGKLELFLANDGFTPSARKHRRYPECARHGRGDHLVVANNRVGWRCRKCYAERSKAYLKAHPEKRREYKRRWIEKNREKHLAWKREYDKRWVEKNREKHLARRREYDRRRRAEKRAQKGGDEPSRERITAAADGSGGLSSPDLVLTGARS